MGSNFRPSREWLRRQKSGGLQYVIWFWMLALAYGLVAGFISMLAGG